MVKLTPYANDKVSSFSMGMKQRLGLAMALLPDPEVLILDEPTNGLDIKGVSEFWEIIRNHLHCVYLGFLLVGWIFTSLSPILMTSYIGIGAMVAGSTIPVASLLTGAGILIGYTLLFGSVAVLCFEKREF